MLDPSSLIDKMLVVGLTRINRHGEAVAQTQVHGRIQSFSHEEGLVITAEPNGRPFRLPPDLSAIQPAPPGTYREHSTGIAVDNPDFIAMWQIHEPKEVGADPSWSSAPRIRFPNDSQGNDEEEEPGSGA